jgi:hypothetical protein
MLRHMVSLRTLKRDHGWIHTLLEAGPATSFTLLAHTAQVDTPDCVFILYLYRYTLEAWVGLRQHCPDITSHETEIVETASLGIIFTSTIHYPACVFRHPLNPKP